MIGAMSGTSADGVDAALVRISGSGLKMRATLVNCVECAFPTSLRERILRVRNEGAVALSDLASLGRDISLAYVDAIRQLLAKSAAKPETVSAAAVHGQTLFHAPPLTIQWIDPALVAVETGIDVVADFRRADCAAGGQGAPLVPFADYILFRSETQNRVLLNIGGIANVTILPKGCSIEQVIGFDTGPGNCISDWLMRDQGGVDVGGRLALAGQFNLDRVNRLMQRPYFHAPFPKSTDGPAMLDLWRQSMNADPQPERLMDDLATAACWVSRSIFRGILLAMQDEPFELIAAGGGTRNQAIMQGLLDQSPGRSIQTTDVLGVPPQARESIAFAILGATTLDRVPANVLSVTGAKRPVVLGAVYPHS